MPSFKFQLKVRPGHQDSNDCEGHYHEIEGELLNERPFYVNGKQTRAICFNSQKWVVIDIQQLGKIRAGETPSPFEGFSEGLGTAGIVNTAWNNYTIEVQNEDAWAGKMLHITLVSADLTHDTETFGKMDPYVRITSEHLGLKSSTCKKGGKTPVWN